MDELDSFDATVNEVALTPEVIAIFPPDYMEQVEAFYGLL